MIAGPPDDDAAVPTAVSDMADGRTVRPVWMNTRGGVTFDVGEGPTQCFVKWAPADSGLDLPAEAARMTWASGFTPVPAVLSSGADGEGDWLATAPLPGETAVSDRWRRDPATAVAAVGAGLRALHDRLPVAGCPFSWSPPVRLARSDHRTALRTARSTAGRSADRVGDDGAADDPRAQVRVSWDDAAHRGLTVAEARRILDDPPPVDRLVVCHGDACAPNTLIDSGHWSGHVDLGALGVADRWADIAIATWSTRWNYGPGWEQALLDAYDIEPDPVRTAYYRLLWDMT